jgi:hypothetical protein
MSMIGRPTRYFRHAVGFSRRDHRQWKGGILSIVFAEWQMPPGGGECAFLGRANGHSRLSASRL